MNFIGLQEVVECNHLLEERGLYYKIHLKDACGKQSLWIEALSTCHCDEQTEDMYACVEGYFNSKGYTLEFSEDKMHFWLA